MNTQSDGSGAVSTNQAGVLAGQQQDTGFPGEATACAGTAVGRPRRAWRGSLATLALVATVSAGVGGGSALAYDHHVAPAQSTTTGRSTGIQTSATTTAAVVRSSASTPNWPAVAQEVSTSVVSIIVTGSSQGDEGTGVVIDNAGHVVTNNHVVSSVDGTIQVQVGNTLYDASVVGTDPTTDLAVLKVPGLPSTVKPIVFANSASVAVGDAVMAVGNPLGLSGTVTTGIVSALDRPVVTQQVTTDADTSGTGAAGLDGQPTQAAGTSDAQSVYTNAIQTSAPINPGNSGGALVNTDGQLVGINSSIASLSGDSASSDGQSGSIGIGFAIPSNQVKDVAQQLIATGKANHPFLGISTTDGSTTNGSVTTDGAKVAAVTAGSPAAAAGLEAGDVIVGLDGTAVGSSDALIAQVHADHVGQKVTVTVVRNNTTKTLTATLGTAPASSAQTQPDPSGGAGTNPGTGAQGDPYSQGGEGPFGNGQNQ